MDSIHPLDTIQRLQLPNGGFPYQAGGEARPDSTSWAVLALSVFQQAKEQCGQGRAYLKVQQADDGRIPLSPHHNEVTWPTPLAIFAWHEDPLFRPSQLRAVDFILGFTGRHFPKQEDSVAGHDPSIRGWPWIADTHSWVIPTSMSIGALKIMGLGLHDRVREAERMLLDRQLPHGGWNYGNTLAFGKELHPLPLCTGIALQALAGGTLEGDVEKSLDYLLKELPRLHTPLSLGWAILGLGAWGLRPPNVEERVEDCLGRQKRYGAYPLPALALLLCATNVQRGFLSLFEESDQHSPLLSLRRRVN